MANPASAPLTDPRSKWESLRSAAAYISEVRAKIAKLRPSEFLGAIERIERAYDEFPELEAEFTRKELLKELQSAAVRMPDEAAITLLLLCAAIDPSSSSAPRSLLEKIARSGDPQSVLPVLHLLCRHRHREFAWDEIEPAVEVLRRRGLADSALAVISVVLERMERISNRVGRELGNSVKSMFPGEKAAAADPAALARTMWSARKRLSQPIVPRGEQVDEALLAMAGRLSSVITAPAFDTRPHIGWPSSRVSFPEFLVQWSCCAVDVPSRLLRASYATLGSDGVLRANRHPASPFCYGPYFNLPAGRYHVQIKGETGNRAAYKVAITQYIDGSQTILVQKSFFASYNKTNIIAELGFESPRNIHNLETVVSVSSRAVYFSISGITLSREHIAGC